MLMRLEATLCTIEEMQMGQEFMEKLNSMREEASKKLDAEIKAKLGPYPIAPKFEDNVPEPDGSSSLPEWLMCRWFKGIEV